MNKLPKIIEYLFLVFLFLLPWQTRLIWREAVLNGYVWEYGRLSLYGTEILLWLIIILFGYYLTKQYPPKTLFKKDFFSRLKIPAVFLYWLIVLLAIISGVSIFWSLDSVLAYFHWVQFLEAICLVAIILNLNFDFKKFAIILISSAGIQSIFAIWQFFNQYIFANKWLGLAEHLSVGGGSIILETTSGRWLRAYGSLPHPNILGGILVIALVLLFYLGLTVQNKKERTFVLLNLVLIVPALFFTFSRSAWVALILVFGLMIFWLYRQKNIIWNKNFIKLFSIFVLIVVILSTIFSGLLLSRVSPTTDLEAQSISLRYAFTKQALTIAQSSWLTGVGLGNYTLAVFEKIKHSWPGYYYQPVHNIYLLVFVELGIFGILIFSLIIFILIYKYFQSEFLRSGIKPSLQKTIIFLSLILMLVISLFDHYFWTLYSSHILFWLIIAWNIKMLKNDDLGNC